MNSKVNFVVCNAEDPQYADMSGCDRMASTDGCPVHHAEVIDEP